MNDPLGLFGGTRKEEEDPLGLFTESKPSSNPLKHVKDSVVGGVVGAADFVAGMIPPAVGGLSMIGNSLMSPLTGKSLEDVVSGGEAVTEKLNEYLLPSKVLGLNDNWAVKATQKPLELLAEGADYVGGKTAEITGSPAVGAAVNAGIQLGTLGGAFKGLQKVGPKVDPGIERTRKGYPTQAEAELMEKARYEEYKKNFSAKIAETPETEFIGDALPRDKVRRGPYDLDVGLVEKGEDFSTRPVDKSSPEQTRSTGMAEDVPTLDFPLKQEALLNDPRFIELQSEYLKAQSLLETYQKYNPNAEAIPGVQRQIESLRNDLAKYLDEGYGVREGADLTNRKLYESSEQATRESQNELARQAERALQEGNTAKFEEFSKQIDELKVERETALPVRKTMRWGKQSGAIDPDVFLRDFPDFVRSVIKNAEGKLKVLYHGTSKDKAFNDFKKNERGIFLTEDPKAASQYALENDSMGYRQDGWKLTPTNTASRVMPVYANITRPYRLSIEETNAYKNASNYAKFQREMKQKAEREGYDGIIYPDDSIVVFDPKQIKSATAPYEKGKIPFNFKKQGGAIDFDFSEYRKQRKWAEETDKQLKTRIIDFLLGKDRVPEPEVLYRGVIEDGSAFEGKGKYTHVTPWASVALRAGKIDGAAPLAGMKRTQEHKYYRGGALEGDPLERTKINSIQGKTWNEALEDLKSVFNQELEKKVRLYKDAIKEGYTSVEEIKRAVAEDIISDFQAATLETDASNSAGKWVDRQVPKTLSRESPRLRTDKSIKEWDRKHPLGGVGKKQGGAIDVDGLHDVVTKIKELYEKYKGGYRQSGIDYEKGSYDSFNARRGEQITDQNIKERNRLIKDVKSEIQNKYIDYQFSTGIEKIKVVDVVGDTYGTNGILLRGEFPDGERITLIPNRIKTIYNGPSPLGGPGKKQGGAINFFGEGKKKLPFKSFDEFADKAKKEGISPESAAKAWVEMGGKVPPSFEPSSRMKAMTRIPGHQKLMDELGQERRPYEQVRDTILNEPDLNRFTQGLKGLVGLNERAAGTKSTGLRWAISQALETKREYQNTAQRLLNDISTGINPKIQKLITTTKNDFLDLSMQLREAEGNPDAKLNLNPRQKEISDLRQKISDYVFKEVNDIRVALGKEPLNPRAFYIPDYVKGPYLSKVVKQVRKGNKVEESVVWITGEKTVGQRNNANKWFRDEIAKLNEKADKDTKYILKEEDAYNISAMFNRGSNGFERSLAFDEVISAIQDSPEAQALLTSRRNSDLQQAFNWKNYKERFLDKSDKTKVKGSGNREWRSAEDNARDQWTSWANTMETALEWVAAQKSRMEIDKLVADPDMYSKPNLKAQVHKAWQDSFNYTGHNVNKAINQWINESASLVGMNGDSVRTFFSEVKHLGVLSVLSLSPKFVFTQHVQPWVTIEPWTLRLQNEYGLKGNQTMSMGALRTVQTMVQANLLKNKGELKLNELKGNLEPFVFESLKHAMDQHVITPHILDKPEHILKRLVPDTAPLHVKAGDLAGRTYEAGKEIAGASIGQPEVATRAGAFVYWATYLHDSGLSKADALKTAENITRLSMVDYNPENVPRVYKKLGMIGNSAASLMRYKHNQYWQVGNFLGSGNVSGAGAMIGIQLALGGLLGLYGVADMDMLVDGAKKLGMIDANTDNMSQTILKKAGDMPWLSHGIPSATFDVNLSGSFSAANPLPDNGLVGAVLPLHQKYADVLGSAYDLVKGRTKNDLYAFLWHMSPPATKLPIEETLGKGESGGVKDPRDPSNVVTPERTNKDKMARLFGTYSFSEAHNREVGFRESQHEKIIAERKTAIKDAYFNALDNDSSPEKLNSLLDEFLDLGGDLQKLGEEYLERKQPLYKRDKALPKAGSEATVNAERQIRNDEAYGRR